MSDYRENLVPLPLSRVSVQTYNGPMTERAITAYLVEQKVYCDTDYVVLQNDASQCAVVAVTYGENDGAVKPIPGAEVLALPQTCISIERPDVDTRNRSALALAAFQCHVSVQQTLVVKGQDNHINFIHHPNPGIVRILEPASPEPSALYRLAQQVLSYADLPPLLLELEQIEMQPLLESMHIEAAYLLPHRSSRLYGIPGTLYFLDEQPPRQDWTLIGCERDLQMHRRVYGDEPPRIEACLRRLAGLPQVPTLLQCCSLDKAIEQEGLLVMVSQGADLLLIERALRLLSQHVMYS